MTWANPNAPNLPDFMLFVRDSMEIDPAYLPDVSPYFSYAFNQALNLVISVPTVAGLDYTLATYNCAGHLLVRIAPDQTGRDFFKQVRIQFDMLKPSLGVVQAASDQGTSSSYQVPDAIGQLTIGDLDFIKTPWGRQYLAYQQDFGGVWGLS